MVGRETTKRIAGGGSDLRFNQPVPYLILLEISPQMAVPVEGCVQGHTASEPDRESHIH